MPCVDSDDGESEARPPEGPRWPNLLAKKQLVGRDERGHLRAGPPVRWEQRREYSRNCCLQPTCRCSSWMAWYRENEDTASNTGSRAGSWHHGYWYHGWHGRRWQAPETDSEDEETNIEVLPDVIKGWLLLEKAGLDTLEENALRAHWTDDQVRRRDGEGRAQANFEDYDDDDEPPEEVADSFFEDWSEEEVALYQAARQSEAEAWAQVQQGRRTLREARERQKEVRLGRKFFPTKGSGKGSGGGARHQATSQGNQHPEGPCLRCGGKHATRSCPKRAEKDDRGALQVDNASAEFVYYQAESLFSEHSNNQVAEQAQNASAPGRVTLRRP